MKFSLVCLHVRKSGPQGNAEKAGHTHPPPIKMYILVTLLTFELPFLLS